MFQDVQMPRIPLIREVRSIAYDNGEGFTMGLKEAKELVDREIATMYDRIRVAVEAARPFKVGDLVYYGCFDRRTVTILATFGDHAWVRFANLMSDPEPFTVNVQDLFRECGD